MHSIETLVEIMRQLRDPDRGCVWDLEQTWASIVPHTLEEAYEVAETIEAGDFDALCDELGDLLFQVVFYARLGEEEDRFSFQDVVHGIAEKLYRRHPHVFGSVNDRETDRDVLRRAWEDQKAGERGEKAAAEERQPRTLDGVSRALPGLSRAAKLQRRAARVGFDWPETAPVLDCLDQELAELRAAMAAGESDERLADEVGDLLFTCVNIARHLSIDPETAMRGANRKFEQRFARVEDQLVATGLTPESATLEDMESAWNNAKTMILNPEES